MSKIPHNEEKTNHIGSESLCKGVKDGACKVPSYWSSENMRSTFLL